MKRLLAGTAAALILAPALALGGAFAWTEHTYTQAARTHLTARALDPDGAKMRNVTIVRLGDVRPGQIYWLACGEINMPSGYGGLTGYERFAVAGWMDGGVVDSWSLTAPCASPAKPLEHFWGVMRIWLTGS